jgi:[ribosomal protein S5]-alanine N-acetyltransferase
MNQSNLETQRLIIRPFVMDDLVAIHRILDQTFGDGKNLNNEAALKERRSWLQWSILNQEWFTKMHQPPLGDRAIVLKISGELIGAVGYVPLLDPFDQIPGLIGSAAPSGHSTTQLGLFWAIDPQHQRRGYATEAAQAMIEHAFKSLHLNRIVATTEHSNLASQGVMRKVGMRLTVNPLPEPHWLQVVGVLENSS